MFPEALAAATPPPDDTGVFQRLVVSKAALASNGSTMS
jgi:hypothetical protein